MGFVLRLLACVLLTLALPMARAAQVALVMSEDGSAFGEAADAIGIELRNGGHRIQTLPYPLRAEDTPTLNNSALIITLGTRAAQGIAALAPRAPILYALLPRSAYERLPHRTDEGRRFSAVFIDQPAARQIELLRLALPDWSRLALLSGRDSAELGGRLQSVARERKLRPVLAQVNDENELYPTLQRVLAEPAILLALPDSSLYNNRTISNILLTAYHQRSPVVGFSPAYVKAGALLALYSTPAQVGQQAGEAARQALAAGGALPAPASPRQFRVNTNTYVARSLGITLDEPGLLKERLERLEMSQ